MNGYKISLEKKNKSVGDVYSRKAQALLDYKMADLKVVYDTFEEAFQKDQKALPTQNYFTITSKHFMIATKQETRGELWRCCLKI